MFRKLFCSLAVLGCVVGSMNSNVEGMKAGDVIFPEMSSADGRLKIKELKVPDCLNKYAEAPEIEAIKLRLKDISDTGVNDLARTPELVDNLMGDGDARENLYYLMTKEDNCSLYCIQDQIAVRLFELGDWNFCWITSQFCTPSRIPSQACADSLLYDDEVVSTDLLAIAGWHIVALDMIRRGVGPREDDARLIEIVSSIDREKLPTVGYISWALGMAKRTLGH